MGWLDTITDNLSVFGDLLGAGAGLAEVFTSASDKKKAQTPQFAKMPIENVLSDFTKYRDFLSRNMTPIMLPTRRMSSVEMNDPVFANQSMAGLQAFADERARQLAKASMPGKPDAGANVAPAQTLPGWNEATQTYQTPHGVLIHGEAGKKAAEEAAMQGRAETLLRERYGDSGLTQRGGKLWNSNVAMPIGGISVRGDSYDNPYTGQTYTRTAAQDAINSGDLDAFRQQGATASYDQTPGWLKKISTLVKPLLVSTVLGPGAGAAFGAAGAGTTAAKLGSKVLAGGFNRVVS